MFGLFEAISIKAGAFFLSLALLLGASAPADVPQQEMYDFVPSQAQEQKNSEKPPVVTKKNTLTSSNISTNSSAPTGNVPLSIENVEVETRGRTAVIRWETTVDARSSVKINGNTFDSKKVSKQHEVTLEDLEKGTRFSYDISAKTLGAPASEDTVSRQFDMAPVYAVSVDTTADKKCYVFTVTETGPGRPTFSSAKPVWGYELNIAGRNNLVTFPGKLYTTDSVGEIEYCESAISLVIEGEDIASVTGRSGVTVSSVALENISTGTKEDYGLFSARFQVTK